MPLCLMLPVCKLAPRRCASACARVYVFFFVFFLFLTGLFQDVCGSGFWIKYTNFRRYHTADFEDQSDFWVTCVLVLLASLFNFGSKKRKQASPPSSHAGTKA